ncbi:MAG TPA: CBS domain-containing protein [Gemmatimonadaceae bacterium]|jgi:CBS domain-containing protein
MLKISDIMTKDVATVTPQTTLQEAVELFLAKHITGAPVVSGSSVVGVVSTADILGFAALTPGVPTERPEQAELGDWSEPAVEEDAAAENEPLASYFTDLWADAGADVADRISTIEGPEWNVLEEHTIDEVMTRDVIALAPNDNVLAAAELMESKDIHRVLVIERGTLVGIVSALDVARAVAEHKLTSRTYVFNRDRDFGEPDVPG